MVLPVLVNIVTSKIYGVHRVSSTFKIEAVDTVELNLNNRFRSSGYIFTYIYLKEHHLL